VFAPAFTMTGIPGALFLPLSLAIGFAMIISYLMEQTFVPIMANWIMVNKHAQIPPGELVLDEDEQWKQKEEAIKHASTADHKLSGGEKVRRQGLGWLD